VQITVAQVIPVEQQRQWIFGLEQGLLARSQIRKFLLPAEQEEPQNYTIQVAPTLTMARQAQMEGQAAVEQAKRI
jgi:hypothetical protein